MNISVVRFGKFVQYIYLYMYIYVVGIASKKKKLDDKMFWKIEIFLAIQVYRYIFYRVGIVYRTFSCIFYMIFVLLPMWKSLYTVSSENSLCAIHDIFWNIYFTEYIYGYDENYVKRKFIFVFFLFIILEVFMYVSASIHRVTAYYVHFHVYIRTEET